MMEPAQTLSLRLPEIEVDIDEHDHSLSILQKLNRMRENGTKCDVIIRVEGKELHVHRNVMMAGSDYFEKMFSHDTKENRSGVVELKDIKYSVVEKCVLPIYTGKLSIAEEECEPLLYAAGLMQLKTVCDKITPLLKNQLNASSFLKIKKIATMYSLENLNDVCDAFALRNLDLIAKNDDFNKLEFDYITFLFSAKQSFSGSEDKKLEILLHWIKADIETRKNRLVQFMELVEFRELSSDYRKHLVEVESLCYESVEFMRELFLVETKQPDVEETDLQICEANTIAVFNQSFRCIMAYEPVMKSWDKLHDLHEDLILEDFTATMIRKVLFVMLRNRKFYKINVLDKDSSWIRLEDMLEDHGKYIRAASCDDIIYVSGQESMERYSRRNMEWKCIECGGGANLCYGASLVECGGFIYSIGGSNQIRTYFTSVYKYDPKSSSWSTVEPMISARSTPAAVSYKGKIYVAGGFCNSYGVKYPSYFLSSVECYDPKANSWTLLADLDRARTNFSLTAVNGKLYAVGGGRHLNIEVYDCDKDNWELKQENKDTITSAATVAVFIPLPPVYHPTPTHLSLPVFAPCHSMLCLTDSSSSDDDFFGPESYLRN